MRPAQCRLRHPHCITIQGSLSVIQLSPARSVSLDTELQEYPNAFGQNVDCLVDRTHLSLCTLLAFLPTSSCRLAVMLERCKVFFIRSLDLPSLREVALCLVHLLSHGADFSLHDANLVRGDLDAVLQAQLKH